MARLQLAEAHRRRRCRCRSRPGRPCTATPTSGAPPPISSCRPPAGEIPAPTAEQLQAFFDERKALVPGARIPGRFGHGARRGRRSPSPMPSRTPMPASATSRRRPSSARPSGARSSRSPSRPRRRPRRPSTGSRRARPSRRSRPSAASPPQDLELGTFAKTEMLDPAVAEAAFALEQGAVSGPVAGRFGPVLVRVTEIQPEAVRPFEEVAAEIRSEIARRAGAGRDRRRSRRDRGPARRSPAAGRDRPGEGPDAAPGARRRREAAGTRRATRRQPAGGAGPAARRSSRPISASTTRRCASRAAAMSGST